MGLQVIKSGLLFYLKEIKIKDSPYILRSWKGKHKLMNPLQTPAPNPGQIGKQKWLLYDKMLGRKQAHQSSSHKQLPINPHARRAESVPVSRRWLRPGSALGKALSIITAWGRTGKAMDWKGHNTRWRNWTSVKN